VVLVSHFSEGITPNAENRRVTRQTDTIGAMRKATPARFALLFVYIRRGLVRAGGGPQHDIYVYILFIGIHTLLETIVT